MSASRKFTGPLERRIRTAWEGSPGPALKLLSVAYRAAADARNLLYDSGLLAARRAPLPVVSIGGLTAGGSGKTPITADIAARLSAAGVVTAILTHGFPDEIEVHRRLSPRSRVYGGRDRHALARRAASEGAQLALLDSGFQHRRLYRDLDVLVLDPASLVAPMRYLPAGPFREGADALTRADLLILVRRSDSATEAACGQPAAGTELEDRFPRLRGLTDLPPAIWAHIRSGPLRSVTEAAREVAEPAPSMAVAGIMWPDVFFRHVREALPGPIETLTLPDHARIGRKVRSALAGRAADGGIVCTLKDAGKLARALGEEAPIWYVSEEVVWEGADDPPDPVRIALDLADRGPEGEIPR